ncbi:peroxiredoxin family protein [Shewanella marina]|uniref:peroxiredoxin family protein n=1 Tax=Shewanella marina TaxID=487319 RepID=UPI0004726F55|nr:redoxin domain-containing protein [Shewanella marina]
MSESIIQVNNTQDITALIKQAPIVILSTYRGDWCPFCVRYLVNFNQVYQGYADDILLVALSVDSVTVCQQLKSKLQLDFELVSDQHLLMQQMFNVTTGKGHGKQAYLQPSVFIFKNGNMVFKWIQQPKLINLGGAINRLPINKVTEIINSL